MTIKSAYKKKRIRLAEIDPQDIGNHSHKDLAANALDENIAILADLQEKLFAGQKHAVLIILQGMDTSGKDGLIKHAFFGINPQGCNVYSFKIPNSFELAHSYMWRYTCNMPTRGMISIFNRSYYEETTAVRVHPEYLKLRKLSDDVDLWKRRYHEFNELERYLTHNGVLVIKAFLHISKTEQLKRLKVRLNSPDKHWKFTISDIRERMHWEAYMNAYEETLNATNSEFAPWHIIPSDKKWYARLQFSQILVDTLKKLNLTYPEIDQEMKQSIEQARLELSRQEKKGLVN
jgi:PPK2 family polyphosphate:nucleotide phosphotransferase